MDALESFKWNTLIDAFEYGSILVAEPLMDLRGGNEAGRGKSEADRQALAERVMRDLYDAGFIYFYREHEAVQDPATLDTSIGSCDRLTPTEVEALLVGASWRGSGPFPSIYFQSTDAGEAFLNDPPEAFRAFWNPDA